MVIVIGVVVVGVLVHILYLVLSVISKIW
eukprot:COSAG01_NODE_37167_length_506_cov_1.899510_1_plen_28_part_01